MSSDSSRSSTPTTGVSKLPPIITNEADRQFLYQLNGFIDREISKVNLQTEEQRYLIYKSVFNKVIEHAMAYKFLLTSIQKEYEDTIEAIRVGHREAIFLQGKLKAMATEPSTLINYRKRGDQLQERVAFVRKENERLAGELQELRAIRAEREKKPEPKEAPASEVKIDHRRIPGMSLEECTDLATLHKKQEGVERTLKELNISLKTRFLPRTHKLHLKDTLDYKVIYRDNLLLRSQVFKTSSQRLKIAVEAAEAYNLIKPPHQTVGDAVMLAFQYTLGAAEKEVAGSSRDSAEGSQADTQAGTFESEDPSKEKESDMMLEYIEKFNELFEDERFEEAAIHAANSPKGILRTQATLAKFRDVKVRLHGRSPLLAFCEALMSTAKVACSKPEEGLSLDLVLAALADNRLDLIYTWLTQDKLTTSIPMAEAIRAHCSCPVPCLIGCQALTQNIFLRHHAHSDVMLCLLRQDKVHMALQYGQLHASLDSDTLLSALRACPSVRLVEQLLEVGGWGEEQAWTSLLPVGVVLCTLYSAGHGDLARDWLHSAIYTQHPPSHNKPGGRHDRLHQLVLADQETSHKQWTKLAARIQADGHLELAIQLLAVVTVAIAMREALHLMCPIRLTSDLLS